MESKTGPHHPRARGHRFPPTPSPSNDHLEALETGKTRHSSRKQGRLQERAPPSDRGVPSNILLSLKRRLNGLVGGVSAGAGDVSFFSFVCRCCGPRSQKAESLARPRSISAYCTRSFSTAFVCSSSTSACLLRCSVMKSSYCVTCCFSRAIKRSL